jgi:hypothetical protein
MLVAGMVSVGVSDPLQEIELVQIIVEDCSCCIHREHLDCDISGMGFTGTDQKIGTVSNQPRSESKSTCKRLRAKHLNNPPSPAS